MLAVDQRGENPPTRLSSSGVDNLRSQKRERERSGEDNKDNKDNEDTKDNDNDKKDNEDNNANDNEDNEEYDNGHYSHQAMTLTEVPSDPFNFFGTDFTLIFIRIPN